MHNQCKITQFDRPASHSSIDLKKSFLPWQSRVYPDFWHSPSWWAHRGMASLQIIVSWIGRFELISFLSSETAIVTQFKTIPTNWRESTYRDLSASLLQELEQPLLGLFPSSLAFSVFEWEILINLRLSIMTCNWFVLNNVRHFYICLAYSTTILNQ